MKSSIPVDSRLLRSAPVSSAFRRSLRRLVGIMIPADVVLGVPGADDDLIFADIVRSSTISAKDIEAALRRLDEFSHGGFADLPAEQQQRIAEQFLNEQSTDLAPLFALVLQCYYRDDRVMCSVGMEVRPPFPKGFEVEQGDWSLLDPVRARPKIYRDAP